MKINKETIKRRTAYFIFWAWHLIYATLVVTVVFPIITLPLILEASASKVPLHYVLYPLLMAILPFVSMFLGAKYFRKNFRLLMKYFYGFEMPLLLFLLVRIITFRDASAGVSLLVINVSIALIAWFVFLWHQQKQEQAAEQERSLINDKEPNQNKINQKHHVASIPLKDNLLAVAGSTIIAMVGLYFGIMFLIIMIPVAVNFAIELGEGLSRLEFETVVYFFINPLMWLLTVFIMFTMSLFIALPIVMIYLYLGQFFKRLPSLFTPTRIAIVLTLIAINVTGFIYANKQPQQAIFTLLEENMTVDKKTGEITDQARIKLLEQTDAIREGLLNAYLSRYRYVSTAGLSNRVKSAYRNTFNTKSKLTETPQNIFNYLASPFLYDGKDWSDKEKASAFYEAFFDAPIQKAERQVITDAVKHNWEINNDNEAGLLDALNHYVHINKQSIDLNVNDGVATVLIKQTLENITYQQLEAVMHFSLPEDAVLTGVWLSDNASKPKKYAYVLAPKGAAQAVYKAEVKRRIDPALLEQTGPTQYRLRVYPILPKSHMTANHKPQLMYMQFEYQTLVDIEMDNERNVALQWPLPTLLEKRNLFWDNTTEYWLNGKKIKKINDNSWLPKTAIHSNAKPNHNAYAKPLGSIQGNDKISFTYRDPVNEHLPTKGNFAILIDGSYSMNTHRKNIIASLEKLQSSGAHYTAYFCQEKCSLLDTPLALNKKHFFGNSQTADHAKGFLNMNKAVDGVFILSDEGSYELSSKTETESLVLNNTPLWLIHLSETVPYAYDDKILDLIYQSKGGITHSLNEALLRYQLFKQTAWRVCSASSTILSITDNRIWQSDHDPKHTCDIVNNRSVTKIATSHQIKHLINTLDLKTNKLEKLDSIHTLAKAQGIISHYSSMLVLVDDRQKKALKKAEEGDDRFNRETETGKQNTSNPTDPFAVPSVPEPEEWALMIICGILLSWSLIRRRYGVGFGKDSNKEAF